MTKKAVPGKHAYEAKEGVLGTRVDLDEDGNENVVTGEVCKVCGALGDDERHKDVK